MVRFTGKSNFSSDRQSSESPLRLISDPDAWEADVRAELSHSSDHDGCRPAGGSAWGPGRSHRPDAGVAVEASFAERPPLVVRYRTVKFLVVVGQVGHDAVANLPQIPDEIVEHDASADGPDDAGSDLRRLDVERARGSLSRRTGPAAVRRPRSGRARPAGGAQSTAT